jgi:allantoin racemase
LRLLYVVVDDLHPTNEELERLAAGGREAAGAGTTFVVEPIEIGPDHYYESAVGLAMAVPGILHKILTEQHRFDAALLGCFGDPGLRAARAVASIPVIGAAEAATAFVQLVAQRYGIVTIVDSDIPEIEVYLSSLEARGRCVGVSAIGLEFFELVKDPDDTLARLSAAGAQLVDKGAEALLLGCMSFGFHPFAAQLQERLGVPVIDPLRAGIAAAQSMLTLGVMPSTRSTPRIEDPRHLTRFLSSLAAPMLRGTAAAGTGRSGS